MVFSCIYKGKKTRRKHIVRGDEDIKNVKKYTYKELKNATGDFSSQNKVGQVFFGSVCKGTLKDGTVVAIKVMSNYSLHTPHDFLNEIATVANLLHENLVRLYGCCVEGDHRILVYHYTVYGNLAEALLGQTHNNIHLSWIRRTRICVGVARGLAFLHEEVQPHIIHGNLSARSILLDSDLMPKISGFEFAKILPEDATHVSTCVAGTMGYFAPDFCITGMLRSSSDVYSFGALLIEIVIGRCSYDMRLPDEEQSQSDLLLSLVWSLYEHGELSSVVDPTLTDDLDTEEACRFLKIRFLCTQDAFNLHPSILKVFQMLTSERDVEFEKMMSQGLISDVIENEANEEEQSFM